MALHLTTSLSWNLPHVLEFCQPSLKDWLKTTIGPARECQFDNKLPILVR